jgi:hypothetical protein
MVVVAAQIGLTALMSRLRPEGAYESDAIDLDFSHWLDES